MRTVDSAVAAAYAGRTLAQRYLIWIVAKDRDTGDPAPVGFWNDIGTRTITVQDVVNGGTDDRDFIGSGPLIEVGRLPLTSDISVRRVTLKLSQIDESVAIAVRGYDARNAPIEIFEAMLDPATRNLVAPAEPLFIGFIDRIKIVTPAEGQSGAVEVECVSHTRELLRANTAVRSHEDQKRRNPTDTFFRHSGVVGEWQIDWGRETSTLGTGKATKRPRKGEGN